LKGKDSQATETASKLESALKSELQAKKDEIKQHLSMVEAEQNRVQELSN